MKPQTRKVGAIIIIIILLAVIAALFIFGTRTSSITEYIEDGSGLTYTFEAYGSRLNVVLTSTGDYMYLKIVADGQTVYEKNNVYDVNFNYNMGFGHHVVHMIIKNPTVFGLGATIQVSGKVSIGLW